MEAMTLKPEGELKSLWYVCWGIPLVIGLSVLVPLFLATQEAASVVFAFIFAFFAVVMFLTLLWIPAYCRTLEYVIDGEAIRSRGGVFWKKHVTIPFGMITHVDVTQGPVERAFGIGTIHVQTAGAGGQEASRAELKLLGVKDLEGVKEAIMERIRGYRAPSGGSGAAEQAGSPDKSPVLDRMLEELGAIRELLEKRKD